MAPHLDVEARRGNEPERPLEHLWKPITAVDHTQCHGGSGCEGQVHVG
jgi:hypothetical protein